MISTDQGRARPAFDPVPVCPPGSQRSPDGRYSWPAVLSASLVASVNVLVMTGFRLPFLGPAIGFWFFLVFPVYLLCTTSVWHKCSAAERVGYSTAAVLLLIMLAGLTINTFLPLFGFRRPLDPVPVVLLGDTILISLFLFRRRHPAIVSWRPLIQTLCWQESRLFVGSVLCVALAVLGANRLNNGAGDQLSLVALGGIVVSLCLLLRWQRDVRDGTISATLYLASLALLLMTSLRGWYVTGHDIQVEYRVFQLTEAHGRWDISYFKDAYDACLSITILPVEVARVVQVANPYVYKVFFQIIFAVCPVLVYEIARRYWSRPISILATIYFIGFPTFFTDMPFLNRQEIAFIFVCVAILSITNKAWGRRWRQLALVVASIGIELSHYSTMYVFLATLLTAWVVQRLSVLHPRRLRPSRSARPARRAPWGVTARTVSIGFILVIAGVMLGWGQFATRTADSALTDADTAISAFTGSGGARSNDVAYGLLPAKAPNPQVLLNNYRQQTLKDRAGDSSSAYVPASVVAKYPTPVVNEPVLPLTGAGRFLSDLGVSAAMLNTVMREIAAKGEQIFAVIGLLSLLLARGLRLWASREMWLLCVANMIVLAILTVFPSISTDYGILRAFQEGLILMAPVLVAGSLTIFAPLGRTWAPRAAAAVCVGILVSTSGLLPQLLGGYPPQLNLNNSGLYYDIYYMHPQEVAAVGWLATEPGVSETGLQASFSPDRFVFTDPSHVNGTEFVMDNYPSLIGKSSWVILGYSTVHTGRAATDSDKGGDLITYKYPIEFLQTNKDLVYSNGGAEIYR